MWWGGVGAVSGVWVGGRLGKGNTMIIGGKEI